MRIRRSARLIPAMLGAATLAACAGQVAPPPVVATVTPTMVPSPMPAGARVGMTIPARLADGSFATPNRALSADAAVWHLRSALNVAALACRGPQEQVLASGYNALLARRAARLKAAQTGLSAEFRAAGAKDWQARYDDAMTRLYNYWAQDFARAGFCQEAGAVLDAAALEPDATFDAFAATRLATLERPFTDFFAAYEAWRDGRLVPATPEPAAAPVTVAALR